jgi:predicted aldo/keto reductase-like oxidoreductase
MEVAEMDRQRNNWSRRKFLRTTGIVGVGALINPLSPPAQAKQESLAQTATLPTRPFGKTGVQVPILSLGGMFDIPSNQLLLKQAVRWGVTYWDTADCYGGGASEKGIGKYFEKYPQDRKKIFLVTKSCARDPEGMSELLHRSLERMKTTYIDLYFVHGIRGIGEIDLGIRRLIEKAKTEGKIRFFGFSTHNNMESCMRGAVKLGGIDGIMMSYNYRLMHTPEMKEAVKRCVEAGIGLTAMKTQGGGPVRTDSDMELELAGHFLQKGFTDKQAKLKAVWQNPNIASICSQMPNMTILMANTAAALDKTQLSGETMKLLERYARETASDYCAGCSRICQSALEGELPVSDVMRYLMYSRCYGERDLAVSLFREIPLQVRKQIYQTDYALAEARCPQKMAIGRLMREAAEELA